MAARRNIAAAVGAVSLILASASTSPAQPFSGSRDWGPGMMMGPGMMGRGGYSMLCTPRAAGLAQWRIEGIERLLTLTDAQRAALNELKTASGKAAEQISSTCGASVPTHSNERLAFMEQRLEGMLLALKTVRPAYEAFYASLSDTQKGQLDNSGPRHWGWGSRR